MTITPSQALGFTLQRQGLGERSSTWHEALQNLVAVQSQYPASVPVALAARAPIPKKGYDFSDIRRIWSLRRTLHVQTAENHALMLAASGHVHLGYYRGFMRRQRGMDGEAVETMEAQILAALQSGPKMRSEFHEEVPMLKSLESTGWGADVMGLAYRGQVVITEQGAARTKFAARRCEPLTAEPTVAMAELWRRYLRVYGPATVTDFAYWLGVYVREVRDAFALLEPELVAIDWGQPMNAYILAEDETALREAEIPRGIRLLPKFDPLVLAWKDKKRILDAEAYKLVIRPAAQIEAVIWMDGRFAGTWRASGKAFDLYPVKRIPKARQGSLEREVALVRKALGR